MNGAKWKTGVEDEPLTLEGVQPLDGGSLAKIQIVRKTFKCISDMRYGATSR